MENSAEVVKVKTTATHHWVIVGDEKIDGFIFVKDAKEVAKKLSAAIAPLLSQSKEDGKREGLKEAAKKARAFADHYPKDVFVEPPACKHGDTVGACSARAIRHACERIAFEIAGEDVP